MLGGATSAPAKEYKAVTKSSSTRSTRRYDKAKKKRPSKPAYRPAPAPRVAAEPRGSEDYKDYGVNKMTDTSEDNLSTFAIDVDTGAYVIARRKINAGGLPPKASVRVEEFVNYFRYEYAQPKSGPFAVSLEAAPSPFTAKKDHYLMRVGVQGKALTSKERKPVHLTFLVDVSGSMNTPDKLGLAQESLKILTNNLKPGDTVALVTYAGNTRVVLEPTGMYERGKILNAIGELTAGGSTAMASGMDLAYKQALTNFKRDHVNRVIVLSDGDTNIGPRNQEEMFKEIKKYVDEGVTLSMIGLGMGNYKDTTMEQLANKGNGNYYYIDTIKESRKVFGEQLDGTLQVIAKDVKIQVEFDKKAVKSYRLIGYENRDIADKDFRDDKVDAGEIGAGHTVTALYEVVLDESSASTIATVRIRHKKPDGYKATENSFPMKRNMLTS
ncbi:MAG: von Willebrand factor type A domain-containing protein, partial [Myxococcota bacterium]|nr:von Willebrand factor type A domain-containing protein [Myxococcota bacterium]